MKLNNNDDSHNSGLNLLIYNMLLDIESHPTWVCGLKPSELDLWALHCRHTLRGCVDWNPCSPMPWGQPASHTLRGCVDWNGNLTESIREYSESHPTWVCGLKLLPEGYRNLPESHTLRGCVDWNPHKALCLSKGRSKSHPTWVCGLKLRQRKRHIRILLSHPTWVCGLKLL